jgi:hypothetical protein
MHDDASHIQGNSERPSQPPRPLAPPPNGRPKREERSNRADFVLFLGVLSLFCCGPLGPAAWIMASRDLRRISDGTLSPKNVSTLKAARVLGIIGTAALAITLVLGVVMADRVSEFVKSFRTPIAGDWQQRPLAPKDMAFAGEWSGSDGSRIVIRVNGTGDFHTETAHITGGRVLIKGEHLTIGMFWFTKNWHIDKAPHAKDGTWTMILDGETFTKKDDGLLVRYFSGVAFPANG